ncbi:hypothetical protein RJ639_003084 [Escallonia herrerae]|uniref:NPH3 domain-containing protein n=1 Tax=Escallonia herrerae TaxID=1293975 RepID=A0AA89AX27_9ASTE|nr:hypothetical protein RJ639_003084 [Escallonia herrerae]
MAPTVDDAKHELNRKLYDALLKEEEDKRPLALQRMMSSFVCSIVRKPSPLTIPSKNEQRELIETVIANLPQEKTSRSSTATRILFGLLKTAKILNASEECKAALEKKIGSQLEQATLDDLLILSYSYLNEMLYNVDCVERILGYFLDGFEVRSASRIEGEDENSGVRSTELMLVGKLIDGYLSEIASDAKLKPKKRALNNLAIVLEH